MRVGIVGAGAWGTALATAVARAGCEVILHGRDPVVAAVIDAAREHRGCLPGTVLAPTIAVTADDRSLAHMDVILAAVPAQALRAALVTVAPSLRPAVPIVTCAKGIERGSGLLMSDVVRSVLPRHPPLALSGPSFAADVGQGLPTAVTLAAERIGLATELGARLTTPEFRLYYSDDLVGVEIGGAVKNVLAIACGIAAGRGLGASAVAALTARAFAELQRFGRASGAQPETLMGLSGFGDLVLTCGSTQSRNYAFGVALGRGIDRDLAGGGRLAEGVATAPILLAKARERGVAMPIVEAVDDILAGRISIAAAVESLLARPTRAEAA